jgi:hypothetical protein
MDGEYFRGAYCPRDGHSNETSIAVAEYVAAMRAEGITPSIGALIAHGYSGSLKDVFVGEFASRQHAPDWLTPSDDIGEP